VFTARYALSPYIKQIRFVFKGLIRFTSVHTWLIYDRDSVVGTVVGYGMDGPWLEPGGGQIFYTGLDRR
jgi:hypothetical protein